MRLGLPPRPPPTPRVSRPESRRHRAARRPRPPRPLGPHPRHHAVELPLWQLFRFGASALAAGDHDPRHAPTCPRAPRRSSFCLRRLTAEPLTTSSPAIFASSDRVRLLADPRASPPSRSPAARARTPIAALAGRHPQAPRCSSSAGRPLRRAPWRRHSTAPLPPPPPRASQNNGQSCIAAKALHRRRGVADAFVERFRAKLAEAVVGDPATGHHAQPDGAARPPRRAPRAGGEVRGARCDAGARRGGSRPRGLLVPGDAADELRAGDAGCGTRPSAEAAAVRVVRDVEERWPSPTRASTRSARRCGRATATGSERVALRLRGGAAFVNAMVKSDPRLPFGGVVGVGWGRELRREGCARSRGRGAWGLDVSGHNTPLHGLGRG